MLIEGWDLFPPFLFNRWFRMKYTELDPSKFRLTVEYRNPSGWELIDKIVGQDAEDIVNMKGLCKRFKISYSTLRYRIKIGLSLFQALTNPKTEPTFFH